MGDQGQALAWLVPSGAHVTHGKSNSRSSSHEKVGSHHHHHGSIEKSHEADIYLGLAKDSQSHRDKTAPTTKPSILVIQDDENDLPRKAWAHSPTGHQSESLLNDRDAPIIALKTFSRAHRPHPSNLSSHQKHDHSNLDYVNTGQHGYVVPVAGASSVNVDLELDIAHLEGRVRDKTKPRSASGRKIKSHKDVSIIVYFSTDEIDDFNFW